MIRVILFKIIDVYDVITIALENLANARKTLKLMENLWNNHKNVDDDLITWGVGGRGKKWVPGVVRFRMNQTEPVRVERPEGHVAPDVAVDDGFRREER